ncbi:MAG: hypothetical protein NUW09_03905 [Deltaproteobacteria bacterium]|nr:hypothetical protein [Deltaproteobacteria bacterium]
MALQPIKGGLVIPQALTNAYPIISSVMALTAINYKGAAIIQAPKTGNISNIGFLASVYSTQADIDVRIETINTSGDPSGTLWAANTNAAYSVTSVGWKETAALTASAAVVAGDYIAVVFANPASGTPSWGLASLYGNGGNLAENLPYCDLYTTSWAKQGRIPVIALKYDDGTYESYPCIPLSLITSVAFNTGSAATIIGAKFKLPVPSRAVGCYVYLDLDANADLILYADGSPGTELMNISLDSNKRRATTGQLFRIMFDAPVSITKDTWYRLALKPTTGTSITLYHMDANSLAIVDSMEMGQNFLYSTSAGGAWTDTTTRRPFMGLIFDQFDEGVSAGGGGARIIGSPIIQGV